MVDFEPLTPEPDPGPYDITVDGEPVTVEPGDSVNVDINYTGRKTLAKWNSGNWWYKGGVSLEPDADNMEYYGFDLDHDVINQADKLIAKCIDGRPQMKYNGSYSNSYQEDVVLENEFDVEGEALPVDGNWLFQSNRVILHFVEEVSKGVKDATVY